jgi:hypothetical protein
MMARATAAGTLGIGRPGCPLTELGAAALYLRGAEILLAAWEPYARGATGAVVQRFSGVAAAVFPDEPERVRLRQRLRDLQRRNARTGTPPRTRDQADRDPPP